MTINKKPDALTTSYEDGMAYARTILQLETQRLLVLGKKTEAGVLLKMTRRLQKRMTGHRYPEVLTLNQREYERLSKML